MSGISRRNVLKTGAAVVAGMGSGIRYVDAADRAGSRYNWGHTMDFGEQYYVRVTEILSLIRRNEMNLIGDISGRMAETLKKGGNVWMQAQAGHMTFAEFNEKNRGNPGILRSSTNFGGSDYDQMKSGDVLMTNYVNEEVHAARERGVYVVGVPVNYVDNEWAPRGFVSPNANDWLLGDVSSVILQSYIPYTGRQNRRHLFKKERFSVYYGGVLTDDVCCHVKRHNKILCFVFWSSCFIIGNFGLNMKSAPGKTGRSINTLLAANDFRKRV